MTSPHSPLVNCDLTQDMDELELIIDPSLFEPPGETLLIECPSQSEFSMSSSQPNLQEMTELEKTKTIARNYCKAPFPPFSAGIKRVKLAPPPRLNSPCAIATSTVLFLLIFSLFYVLMFMSFCSNFRFTKVHLIENISTGFEISSPRGTFRTVECHDCSDVSLRVTERNNRDKWPRVFIGNKEGKGYSILDWSFKSWLVDCYTMDVELLIPNNLTEILVLDDVKIEFTLGLTHKEFPYEYPIYFSHHLHVLNLHIYLSKETTFSENLIVEKGYFHTTARLSLTLPESNLIDNGIEVITNFGIQNVSLQFSPDASNYSIKSQSHTGNVGINLIGPSQGSLEVKRTRNNSPLSINFNGSPIESPFICEFGTLPVRNNTVVVSTSSPIGPGSVYIRYTEDDNLDDDL
ncbi:hypothetical protein RCL1_003326 [Eukaryota sp. TZLM3-RCL]